MPAAADCRWLPVALSRDLPPATVISARLPGAEIALWRSASGDISAVKNRCPHRGMRLSHGYVRGEALSCIYHGWSFGQDGHCRRIPAHPEMTPPDLIRLPRFAAEEKAGVIWVCEGEAEGAPPDVGPLAPLRTLVVRADRAALLAAGADEAADGLLGLGEIRLLTGFNGEDELLLHVLVPPACDAAARIAASRRAEGLRRAAEAISLKGAA